MPNDLTALLTRLPEPPKPPRVIEDDAAKLARDDVAMEEVPAKRLVPMASTGSLPPRGRKYGREPIK